MNEVLKAIVERKSVRSFTDKKIEKADLEKITQAAYNAPSGMNRQLWKFTIIQNKELLGKLSAAIEKEFDREYRFFDADAIILVSNDRDNHLGVKDTACAMENIFLSAYSLGIGSVWINGLNDICDKPGIREVLNELKLPKDHIVYGTAALGYSNDEIPKKDRNTDVVEWFL